MKTMFALPAAAAPLGLVLLAPPTLAYVGPGLGFGAIAAILGVVFSVFLAVFAVVWYPIKRLLGIGKKPKTKTRAAQQSQEQGQ
jgi:hypothetical protein